MVDHHAPPFILPSRDARPYRQQWECFVSRRISDRRPMERIHAEALAEEEERMEAREESSRAVDDAEIQYRYDNNDEGGSRE